LLKERYGTTARVRLIATTNQGQLAAMTSAVAACEGDAIAFLDADDRWRPEHLETLAGVLSTRPGVDFVYGNLERFGREQGAWHAERSDRDLGVRTLQEYHLQPWFGSPTSALLLRRELCQRVLDLPAELRGEWVTRADDAYLARLRRLVDGYGRKAGLGVLPPMAVIIEFKGLPKPTLGDLGFYLRMLRRVPWSPLMFARQWLAMCLHYLRRRS
jgi:glycosyltransferase involved in cell wall biosynthesis